MKKTFFAHSENDKGQKQELTEHLLNVAELASCFAEKFSSGEFAYVAGVLHDLGKGSVDFQKLLENSSHIDSDSEDNNSVHHKKINHSSAGAIFATKNISIYGKMLAYLIAGHHAGLADWNSGNVGNAALSQRLSKDVQMLDKVTEYIGIYPPNVKKILKAPVLKEPQKACHFWIRMLFSCLVDADYLDTERFMSEEKYNKRKNFFDLSELYVKFSKELEDMELKSVKSEVNNIRAQVRRYCETVAENKPGIYTLAVPTGGGKTLSAMAFAFKHAQIWNKKRIIYVIPYTSIIEQTADVLRKILGENNVVEHHSNLDAENETENSRLATENWDAPIIVTTSVQFFESLYASKSSCCRKLHNISNSVVILDEVQLLPPTLLTPCKDAIKHLALNFATTIVLSTATQPVLIDIGNVKEIIPKEANLYEHLKRVEFEFPEISQPVRNWRDIVDELQKHHQVLCVVNTRKDCYDLFKLMPKGTIHLSALMCGQHRSSVIAKMKEDLKKGNPVRVVSTQLIEAGVDVDFPVGYRALAGIDSIIQFAGRVNREGKLDKLGKVIVFYAPKAVPQGMLRKSSDAAKEIFSQGFQNINSPEIHEKYFKHFYGSLNNQGDEEFNKLLVNDAPKSEFQFKTASEKFKIIDDYSKAVVVNFGESFKLIRQLEYNGLTKELMRKLQRYIVNIPEATLKVLLNHGLIRENKDGIYIQEGLQYLDETGLDIYNTNIPLESLII